MRGWRWYLVRTTTSTRTTWTLRLAALVLVVAAAGLTRGFWAGQIGRSLVCAEDLAPSDVILVENFDPTYPVFERAAALQSAGFAPRTWVLVEASGDPAVANPISSGLADLMARHARLRDWQVIPVTTAEPVSLNAAVQLRGRLAAADVRSMIVVTRAFRSRRSDLVYRAVLDAGGVRVHCLPVFVTREADRWAESWHGIQEVGEQFLKLQYYRFYVLPAFAWTARGSAGPSGQHG